MEQLLRAVALFLLAVITGLVGVFLLFRILQRLPGIIVGASAAAIIVFGVALYHGSFKAIGLRTKFSVVMALVISILLFILSGAVLVLVK